MQNSDSTSPGLTQTLRGGAALALAVLATGSAVGSDAEWIPELKADVQTLAGAIGARGVYDPGKLRAAADYIVAQFERSGWKVRRLPFAAGRETVFNLEVELLGITSPEEIVLIGAHYDTVPTTPGADDNASGVAVLLSLARRVAGQPALPRTLRFVAFVNEEPAYFQTALMGSWVYAKACRAQGERIVAMVSLDSLGFYSDAAGSQRFPDPALGRRFPTTGNFLAFVSNAESEALVARAGGLFRAATSLACESVALPAELPGAGWSDHWAFWQEGYRAIMVTDTAVFRNPQYHRPGDTPETLDYTRLAAAAVGLLHVARGLAGP